jgi:dUTP pyrophosphatase
MKIKVKKMHRDAIIPEFKTSGASGFDIHALEEVYVSNQYAVKIRTGLAFDIPEGYEMQIRPRSGVSLNTKFRIANSPATIDSDFTGEVMIIIDYLLDTGYTKIDKGTRIAQGVICPVIKVEFEEVESIDKTTDRGHGGFGSTGF